MSTHKKTTRILSMLLTVLMILQLFVPAITVYAVEDHDDSHDGDHIMSPYLPVYVVGDHSYYKIKDEGEGNYSVVFADRLEDDTYKSIASYYIGGGFGIYLVNGKPYFIPLSLCSTDGEGHYIYAHGTDGSAAVSERVDTADNNDPSMSTQFYVAVGNGVDDDISKEEPVDVESVNSQIGYEITVQTKMKYQLRATVPMFVCMYGYRGTGTVQTPAPANYSLKNYSTIDAMGRATISSIVKVIHMTRLYDEDHKEQNIVFIGYSERDGYTAYYEEPSAEEIAARAFDASIRPEDFGYIVNGSGEMYVAYIDGQWLFREAGTAENGDFRTSVNEIPADCPLAENFVFGGFDFGRTMTTGDFRENGDDYEGIEGLAVRVAEVEAKPMTWKLVDSNIPADQLKRGELAMTLAPAKALYDASQLDLSKYNYSRDITERGWYLDAPKVVNGEVSDENATKLGIITEAHMAGGNVNGIGCSPVVRVTYKFVPIFANNDTITSTVGQDAVINNELLEGEQLQLKLGKSSSHLRHFDVYINGALAEADVTTFTGKYDEGTTWEIRDLVYDEGYLPSSANIYNGTMTGHVTNYVTVDPVVYTTVFNSNGGNEADVSVECVYDKDIEKPDRPTRDGFVFLGWSEDPGATEPEYKRNDDIRNLTATQGAVITLYAVWAQ